MTGPQFMEGEKDPPDPNRNFPFFSEGILLLPIKGEFVKCKFITDEGIIR